MWLREERLSLVLPIERSSDGVWQQKARYSQPDLHDELVLDIDGPFSSVASAETYVVRFVVTGDRNAGKSTLLHAFVNAHDRDWLRVTSLLPVLTGTFANARFAGAFEPSVPRDELPYLDTDVARCTLVLTREDFLFFLREFDLPVVGEMATYDYAAIEFLELGGDHLDAMIQRGGSGEKKKQHTAASALHAAALDKSTDIVTTVDRFAYFLNCDALIAATTTEEEQGKESSSSSSSSSSGKGGKKNQGRRGIDVDRWNEVIGRLRWLRNTSRRFESMTLFASRLPSDLDPFIVADLERRAYEGGPPPPEKTTDKDEGNDDEEHAYDDDDDDPERRAVVEAVRRDDAGTPVTRALLSLLRRRHPELGVAAVRPARHVRPGHAERSSVDVPGLASVLVSLFRRDLASSRAPNVDRAVRAALFRCAANAAETIGDDNVFAPFVAAADFQSWLDDDDDDDDEQCQQGCSCRHRFDAGTVVPPHLALARFEPAAATLLDRGLLVRRVARGHADVAVCVTDDEDRTLAVIAPSRLPPGDDDRRDNDTRHDVVYAQRGGPAAPSRKTAVRAPLFPPLLRLIQRCFDNDLLHDDHDAPFPAALRPDLTRVSEALDAALVDAIHRLRPADDSTTRRLLWLAEDRLLVHRLETNDRGSPQVAPVRTTTRVPRDPSFMATLTDYDDPTIAAVEGPAAVVLELLPPVASH